jgi:hypothetical protein
MLLIEKGCRLNGTGSKSQTNSKIKTQKLNKPKYQNPNDN